MARERRSVSDWRDLAACKGKPTAWWFPIGAACYGRARRICSDCPVSGPCLSDAIKKEHDSRVHRHGMFGGLTPPERHRYARRRDVRVA